MRKLHIIWLSVHFLLLQPFAEQPAIQISTQSDFVTNECLIKFKPGTNGSLIDSISHISKFTILAYYPNGRFYRVRTPANLEVPSFIKSLDQHPAVELAQPDYYITTFNYTTDSLIPLQWNAGTISSNDFNISITPDTVTTSSDDVVVSIIDGGVAFENYQNYKKAHALSDTRFCSGFDFVSFDEHPNDDAGNGTLVTTIISNLLKNISDSSNSANRTLIMPVKVTDKNGNGRTSGLVEGILFAVNNGADILTISAGGPDSPLLNQAIVKAFNRGATIICAAGNATCPKSHYYPAAYNQYCIAVTANGYDLQSSSVQHGDYIDLSAPGEILFHNVDPAGYSRAQGTSIAAAQVTATAVLLKISGIDGSDRIRQALEQSCIDKPPRGWDWQTGWGMLDAQKTPQFFPRPAHDIQVTSFKVSPWCIKGELLQTITTVRNQGTFEHDISLTLSDIRTSRILATASGSLKPHQSSQFIMEWNTAYDTAGTHLVFVSANISGDEDPADNIQYKDVFVAEDKRDVEISGVEFKKRPEKNNFLANIQIRNSGTYNEIIHIRVQNASGAILGQKDTQICAQCIMFIPVQCQLDSEPAPSALVISIETADLQECNVDNNKFTCPFTISE